MKTYLKKHIVEIILFLILLAGLCLILYPTVSDWWNSRHQTRAIASYVEDVKGTSEEDRQAMREAAAAYNERLAGRPTRFILEEDEVEEYESLLDVSGTGIMGYVDIPSISVHLPIYHGNDESVLQVAIGHIPGSSLPIGGPGTHSIISGHRGLPSARLFTDLDQLSEGNIFQLNVLGETLTYQVDQIRIVLPEDIGELSIVEGEDYCTLITCTPYGVNTHRILVRGHRIANTEGELIIASEAVKLPVPAVVMAVGVPILLLTLAIFAIYSHFHQPKKSEKEILEDLRNQ